MKTLVPLLLLAFPVSASMSIGPEVRVAPPSYSTAITEPQTAATDGSRFLVFSAFGPPLRVSVVSPDGTTSVPSRVISPGQARGVAVVWTGDAYLATWSEGSAIIAARLSADGTIIAPPSKILDGTAPERGQLAWNGSEALLLYMTTGGKFSLALLAADGHLLKDAIAVASGSSDAAGVLTATGNAFVYCWTSTTYSVIPFSVPPPLTTPDAQVFALRIRGDGSVGPANLVAHLTASVSRIGIASDGQRYAVSFTGSTASAATLYRHVIAADDSIVQLPAITLPSFSSSPGVAWNGHEFMAYWISYGQTPPVITTSFDLNAINFSASSTPATVLHAPRYGIDPIAVSSGPATLVLWSDFRFTDRSQQFSATFAAVLDRDGQSVIAGKPDGFSVSLAATPESGAKIAATGSGALAVWMEGAMPAGNTITAVRLDARGAPVGAPVPVATGVVGAFSVIAIRDLYLVLWSGAASGSAASVFGRRIRSDGTFLDAAPVAYSGDGSYAAFTAVSAGNSGLLVLTRSNGNVVTVAIDGQGTPAATAVALPAVSGYSFTAASNGTEYLLTWTQGSDYWQFPAPNLLDVVGLRIAPDGTALDGAPIAIATGPKDQMAPTVASDGRDFLVVYATSDGWAETTSVTAKRVLSTGVLADTTADSDGTAVPIPAWPYLMSLLRAGAGYALTWESQLSGGGSTAGLAFLDARANVTERFDTVASSAGFGLAPAIALTPFGMVMAYSRVATEPEYAVALRVFVRQISSTVDSRHRVVVR